MKTLKCHQLNCLTKIFIDTAFQVNSSSTINQLYTAFYLKIISLLITHRISLISKTAGKQYLIFRYAISNTKILNYNI